MRHGPLKDIPANLIDAGDYGVFYPINRCYAHCFSKESCTDNALYRKALDVWLRHNPSLPIMVGEYYNVSKFEDLPLLFTKCISRDIPFYISNGVKGITYMHVPMVNWGVRTLTQILYAQIVWDKNTDTVAFIDEYFNNWYGPYAEKMHLVYEMVERAWLHISGWRSWSSSSILS